ncbi:MAG: hypothetical protein ACLGSD_16035 [Acidobacteriota bacterium]
MSQSSATNPNEAVDRCWAAYRQAHDQAIAEGTSREIAGIRAEKAYRRAMPRLHTRDEIRAFLACVADGLLFEIIYRSEGPYLLASARAATAALPREVRPVGRPKPPAPSTEELTPPVLEK